MESTKFLVYSLQDYNKWKKEDRVVLHNSSTPDQNFRFLHGEGNICPLYVAIINHDEKAVKKIRDHQVDPSATYCSPIHPKFKEGRFWTYISYALYENYEPMIKVLLEDVRVVRAIFKQNYQPLRWCFENEEWTESLSMILDVIGQDKNDPTEEDLDRIKFSMDVLTSLAAKKRNWNLLVDKWEKIPMWLQTIAYASYPQAQPSFEVQCKCQL